MDGLLRDLRYAVRTCRRRPGPVAAAIAALALGIGSTTMAFSVVTKVLVAPLPFEEPDRLVMVWQDARGRGGPEREWASPGIFSDWQERSTTFDALGAIRGWTPNLTGGGEPERLRGALVSAGYFAALRVPPLLGRAISGNDDQPGGPPVATISHGLWVRRFGADPSLAGRTVVLDGVSTTITGVMPESFRPPVIDADVWSPLRINPSAAQRGMIVLRVLGRLKDGITLPQAQAAMAAVQAGVAAMDPDADRTRIALVPLQEEIVGSARVPLLVLSGAVGLVLLIACANVSGLLLVRASERAREIAVRVALGASRTRIIRGLLAESLLLSLMGGLLGIWLAAWGVSAVPSIAPASVPRLHEVTLDAKVLLVGIALTLAASVLSGLAPAITAGRTELTGSLRDGGRESTSASRLRSWLVAVEIALAMMLAVGAGLLLRSFNALQHVDLGFRTAHVLTASVSPPRGAYQGDENIRQLTEQLITRVQAVPGVRAVATTSVLPLSGMNTEFTFDIVGRPRPASLAEQPVAWFRIVSPGYFGVMGMRLVGGRLLIDDDKTESPNVMVVNEAFARRYWPGQSPIGAKVDVQQRVATIVGVVADVRHRGPAQLPDPEMYLPYTQFSGRGGWLVVQSAGDPAALSRGLRSAVHDVDPNLPLASVATMETLASASVAQPRFLAMLLTGFAALATGLALLGVYGVLSFAVSRRVREIGVRMALGASESDVVRLVLGQSVVLAAGGIFAGAACAALLTRLMRGVLYGVQPGDPLTIVTLAIAIAIASLAAGYVPARRAARINPIAALRED